MTGGAASVRALCCGLLGLLGAGAASAQTPGRIAAAGGDIVFTPLINSSVRIEHAGKVIYVDPWSAVDLSQAKQADLILITDEPVHHFDPQAIARLRKPGAPVVVTAKVHAHFPDGRMLANGKSAVFAGIPVESIAGYDLTPGDPYHPPGEANGYLITLGGKRVFYSAVSECVPEIRALRDIEVAFLPMNSPVDRMRPIPAAECAKTFKPRFVYLHHYDTEFTRWIEVPTRTPPSLQRTSASLRTFSEALKGSGITFWNAKWYPDYPPEPEAVFR
jgi:L-ascorbate metabolism protein UlaG (beta-lactamase superfamily)